MGVHNLNKFLRNNCPVIYEKIHISEYSFKKVAIDISLYLCKYKTICGDRWLLAFINLITCLRKNEVHCVFIYDSGAPPEKDAEKQVRLLQRQKLQENVYKLEEALEKFKLSGEIDKILIDLYKKRHKGDAYIPRLMKQPKNDIDMTFLESLVIKMRGQILDISKEDFRRTKELFDILQIPYFDAPLEAETTCSDLCKSGLVDAVLSEDTDVLAYGCPSFLSAINTSDGVCTRINYSDMLKSLKLSSDEFLDLCIMCGCDYNKNIFRVGPEKAYKFIQQYSSIEEIAKNTTYDIKVLNHVRVRQLFRNYEKVNFNIKYCGTPDFKKLEEFLFKYNIKCFVEGLKKSFVHHTTIIFTKEDIEQHSVIEEDKEILSVKIEK